MQLNNSVATVLGRRIADALAGLKADCAGLEGLRAKASAQSLPSGFARGLGSGPTTLTVLSIAGVGWSPSLHRCDLDLRIVEQAQVAGVEAMEDLVLVRIHHALAIQRARAQAFRDLVECGVFDHDEDARVKPLTRSAAGAGPDVSHLLADAANLHAARLAGMDERATFDLAGDALSGLHRQIPHDMGRILSHDLCAVAESAVDDPLHAPSGDPGDEMETLVGDAIAGGWAHGAAVQGAAEAVVERFRDQPRIGAPADRHVAFQVALPGGALVTGDRVQTPGLVPDSALAQLPGRPLGDLVRLGAGLDGRTIVEVVSAATEQGHATIARLAPEPWPMADIVDLPRA